MENIEIKRTCDIRRTMIFLQNLNESHVNDYSKFLKKEWVAKDELIKVLEKHRSEVLVTCDKSCFCWILEILLLEKESTNSNLFFLFG